MNNNSMATCKPPFLLNPTTKLWWILDANSTLVVQFLEYIKLAQIAMVHILGSVEDELCFSSLFFMKDKLHNRLAIDHLGVVIGIHKQNIYTLENFLYDNYFKT
jgi:hypothetical protein